jgi:TM2 domain-containing membrane protein YozV
MDFESMVKSMSNGQGSAGNVIAALCSLFVPGLGQLIQGRFLSAVIFFLGASVLWFISFGTLGWIIHLWACLNSARWNQGS